MTKFITSLMLVMAMVAGSAAFAADSVSTEVVVPELTGRAMFLGQAAPITMVEKEKIKNALEKMEALSKVHMTVLVVDSTEPFAIEEYAIKVAEKWKIGEDKKDNGVILIIAAKDKKARLEVGYGWEGVITDAMASRIINEYMIPQFKENRWGDGVMEAIAKVNNLALQKPLDAPMDPYLGTVSVTPQVEQKSSGSSVLSSSLKNADGEAVIIILIIAAIVALFTTGIGKGILIGVVLGGLMSNTRKTLGASYAAVIGSILSGGIAYFILDGGAWIGALIAGAICGAFGLMWLLDVLQIVASVAANSRSGRGSSRSGGSYSGGGGRFGGGGSTGSW